MASHTQNSYCTARHTDKHPQSFPAPAQAPVKARGSGWSRMRSTVQEYFVNQEVEVRISGNAWVMGIVVAILQFSEQIGGFPYRVNYQSSHGQLRQADFPPNELRPPSRY